MGIRLGIRGIIVNGYSDFGVHAVEIGPLDSDVEVVGNDAWLRFFGIRYVLDNSLFPYFSNRLGRR